MDSSNKGRALKIVVCVKQISYVYSRTGQDPETNFVTGLDQVSRINPCDEAGLALALKVKSLSRSAEVIVLTFGPFRAEREVRLCLAAGADGIYQIPVDEPIDPWVKSDYLTKAIEQLNAGLILCGERSLDTGHGQIAALLAHRLGVPFISCVREISISNECDHITVQRSGGRGTREILHCSLPAVLSTSEEGNSLAAVSYVGKRRAATLSINKILLTNGVSKPVSELIRVFPPRPRAKWSPVPGPHLDAYYRIEQLLAGSKVEKKGKKLDGPPEDLVKELISFLENHGFLARRKQDNGT